MVLVLEEILKGTEISRSQLKEFGALAGFKMSKQKRKILRKNVKITDQTELMNKIDFKIEKSEMSGFHYNTYELYCMLFQNILFN